MPAFPTIQEDQPLAKVFRGLVDAAQTQLSAKHSHHLLARHFANVHNALSYPPEPVPTAKRSSKLSGYRNVIEVCCDENSQLGITAKEFDRVTILRITQDVDLECPQTFKSKKAYILDNPGVSLHGSLPCTTLSSWQQVCVARYGVEYAQTLETRRQRLRRMLKKFLALASMMIMNGGIVAFEWPRHCPGWMFSELLLFILKRRMFVIDVDGCACGLVDENGLPHLSSGVFCHLTHESRKHSVY